MFSDEEGEAQHSVRDFAWQLVLLGRVFDAVPGFKELVRMQITILMDRFLEMPWGFMYVFKLGMALEQGKWFQDENQGEALGAHFKCFRSRLWKNQNVATQKNASATVSGIVGKSLTFGRQGDVQHVTEVVNGSTLLAGCEVLGILLRGALADSPLGTSRKRW